MFEGACIPYTQLTQNDESMSFDPQKKNTKKIAKGAIQALRQTKSTATYTNQFELQLWLHPVGDPKTYQSVHSRFKIKHLALHPDFTSRIYQPYSHWELFHIHGKHNQHHGNQTGCVGPFFEPWWNGYLCGTRAHDKQPPDKEYASWTLYLWLQASTHNPWISSQRIQRPKENEDPSKSLTLQRLKRHLIWQGND